MLVSESFFDYFTCTTECRCEITNVSYSVIPKSFTYFLTSGCGHVVDANVHVTNKTYRIMKDTGYFAVCNG
jgi:hypothetical protein